MCFKALVNFSCLSCPFVIIRLHCCTYRKIIKMWSYSRYNGSTFVVDAMWLYAAITVATNQATGCASKHYSVPVPSQDKVRGLQQKVNSA